MTGCPRMNLAPLISPLGTIIRAGTVTDEQERAQPSGVWATAVGVARARALETERENALFRDPLAHAFATAARRPGEPAGRARMEGRQPQPCASALPPPAARSAPAAALAE